ncbi:sterile alpha motif (SAM) domain-containing protein [Actinidia rufa]|uniref:Sterile alpha motif (SAM) domain-containing protein n=1 Tax=Actinidia rufa TaxID=165716 RepID=A0A7J0FDK2_9ERIC|nr:sterile alpha motif (SAM) domain-containing protein [Actinidia rufa]
MATNSNSEQSSSSVFQAADFDDDDDFQDSNCPTPTSTPRFVNNHLKIISNAKNRSCSLPPHLKPLNSSKSINNTKNPSRSKQRHLKPLNSKKSINNSKTLAAHNNDISNPSIPAREQNLLLASVLNHPVPYDYGSSVGNSSGILDNHEKYDDGDDDGFSEPCTQLDLLLKLRSEQDGVGLAIVMGWARLDFPKRCGRSLGFYGGRIFQGAEDSSKYSTSKGGKTSAPFHQVKVACPNDDVQPMCPGQVVDISPVLEWLRNLGLAKYEEIFVQEEIDWDTLQGPKEEDLFSIGVTALGPRKKIIHALSELRKDITKSAEISIDTSRNAIGETSGLGANKLITNYFPGTVGHRKNDCTSSSGRLEAQKNRSDAQHKQIVVKKKVLNEKLREIPQWCCVSGTPFRVAVLHTGDFRFCQEMTKIPVLQMRSVQTLILDTTYCNPQDSYLEWSATAIPLVPKISSSIAGNVRLMQELVRNYHGDECPTKCVVKIDLMRAYDSVDRDLLFGTMIAMDFPDKFIKWTMQCVTTVVDLTLPNSKVASPDIAKLRPYGIHIAELQSSDWTPTSLDLTPTRLGLVRLNSKAPIVLRLDSDGPRFDSDRLALVRLGLEEYSSTLDIADIPLPTTSPEVSDCQPPPTTSSLPSLIPPAPLVYSRRRVASLIPSPSSVAPSFDSGNPDPPVSCYWSLQKIHKLSGLKPNMQKSSVFFSRVDRATNDELFGILSIPERTLPVKYLGVPLITTSEDCSLLKENTVQKIQSMSNKLLSHGGRAQLIQLVLFSAQIY